MNNLQNVLLCQKIAHDIRLSRFAKKHGYAQKDFNSMYDPDGMLPYLARQVSISMASQDNQDSFDEYYDKLEDKDTIDVGDDEHSDIVTIPTDEENTKESELI